MANMIHRLAKILDQLGRGSRTKLANDTGISASNISDLCYGNDRMNEDHIEKISKALKIPAWHLLADPEDVYPSHDKAVVSAYLSLEDDERKIVDKFLFPFDDRPSVPKNPPLATSLEPPSQNRQTEQ